MSTCRDANIDHRADLFLLFERSPKSVCLAFQVFASSVKVGLGIASPPQFALHVVPLVQDLQARGIVIPPLGFEIR